MVEVLKPKELPDLAHVVFTSSPVTPKAVSVTVIDRDAALQNVRRDGTEWVLVANVLFAYRAERETLIVLPDRTISTPEALEPLAAKLGFPLYQGAVQRPEQRRDSRFGGAMSARRPGLREEASVAINAQMAESFFRSSDTAAPLKIAYPGGWQVGIQMTTEAFAEMLG